MRLIRRTQLAAISYKYGVITYNISYRTIGNETDNGQLVGQQRELLDDGAGSCPKLGYRTTPVFLGAGPLASSGARAQRQNAKRTFSFPPVGLQLLSGDVLGQARPAGAPARERDTPATRSLWIFGEAVSRAFFFFLFFAFFLIGDRGKKRRRKKASTS